MKAIKITLAVVVIAAIAFFVIWSLAPHTPPPPPPPSKNQFTEKIKQEIDSLSKLPDSKFCKDFYQEIGYHIDDFYKQNRFGSNQSENDQQKEYLTTNLYSAYADKFINQAYYVFQRSEWKPEDLNFIRSEYQTLQKSPLLKKGPVANKFTEIQNIFSKYDEISRFIYNNKGFAFEANSLSEHFPIADVQAKLSQVRSYQNSGLGNGYVNKCTRLHDGLKEISQNLFRAHVRYLDRKINYWSGSFSKFISQKNYADNLYTPLKSEIDALRNVGYNADNLNSEYNRLLSKWDDDSRDAFNFFKNKKTN